MAASSKPNVYEIRIALLEYEPQIWRRLLVPASVSLDRFHLVIQAAMGWENSHLHQFFIAGRRYGMHVEDWPEDELDEVEYTLADVTRRGRRFVYEYDFGDSWDHEVLVERSGTSRPALKFAVCLDGANACPPEDCGGTGGYGQLLEVLADPAHEDHEEYKAWAGEIDPSAFDLAAANATLQRISLAARSPRRQE